MGTRIYTYLEYDGENPVHNDFICELGELFSLRDWDDVFHPSMSGYSSKEYSPEIQKDVQDSYYPIFDSWAVSKIQPQIEEIRRKMEIDTELDKWTKENLEQVIKELEGLYEQVTEICGYAGLEPEKCYVLWSHHY